MGAGAGAVLLKKLGTGVEATGGVGVEEGGGAGLSKKDGILVGAVSFGFNGSEGVEGVPKLKDGMGGFRGATSGFWKNDGTVRPPGDAGFSTSFGGGGFGVGAGSGAGVGVAAAKPFVAFGLNTEPLAAGVGGFWNALPEAKALLGPNALPDENALPFPLLKADVAPIEDGKALDAAGVGAEGKDGVRVGAGVDESIFLGWYTGAVTLRVEGAEEGTILAAGLPSTDTPPAPLTTSAYDAEPCLSVISFHRRVNGASLLSVG